MEFCKLGRQGVMVSELLERLQENGQMATDTARCVAKLLSGSMLHGGHIARLRSGVATRQWEISRIRDQLMIRDRTSAIDRMIEVANQIEKLWIDVAEILGPDDLKKAA